MIRVVLGAAVGCLLVARVAAAPVDSLGSASQHVRDAAAERLRETFVPTPRSQWEPIVAALKSGASRDSVLRALQPYAVTKEGVLAGGGSSSELYRLDDVWILKCSYGRSKELFQTDLHEHLRHVWVAPSSDFTGVWTTYFVNGRRSHEIHYENGRYSGTLTTFRPDGSKSVVQHYGANGAEGEGIGYFPSGAVQYRGQSRSNAQVGTWVWYNEDGSVRSTQEYPNAREASREPD